MIGYAFNMLKLRRIVATTTYDNAASIGVMRKVGMRIDWIDHYWTPMKALLEHG